MSRNRHGSIERRVVQGPRQGRKVVVVGAHNTAAGMPSRAVPTGGDASPLLLWRAHFAQAFLAQVDWVVLLHRDHRVTHLGLLVSKEVPGADMHVDS